MAIIRLPVHYINVPSSAHYYPRYGMPHKKAGQCAYQAVQKGVELCRTKQADALVTAPVSKYAVSMSVSSFKGHTEMLAELCSVRMPVMMMQAGELRFIMVTRHIPLSAVAKQLSAARICRIVEKAYYELRKVYGIKIQRAVVCSLNPHAGEEGRLGAEEKRIIKPAVVKLRRRKIPIEGPMPADAAVRKTFQKEYDLCFGMYHDQVMIPLKAACPRHIVNVTLGLPFVRTSPGHGAAYDIAGKNKADSLPMEEAIRAAVDMVKRKNKYC